MASVKHSGAKGSCRWQIIAIIAVRIYILDQACISTRLWTCPVPSEDLCTHVRFTLFLLLFSRLYKSLGRSLRHCNSYPELVSAPFTRFLLMLPDPKKARTSSNPLMLVQISAFVVVPPWQRGTPPAAAYPGKGRGWRCRLRPAFFICSHSIMFYSDSYLLFHGSQGLHLSPPSR